MTKMAFWSGTDNNDDSKRNRYSVVIGKLSKLFPDIKCRFSYDTKHTDLDLDDLFVDSEAYLEVEDFAVSIENISEQASAAIIGSMVYHGAGNGVYSGRYGHGNCLSPDTNKKQYGTYFNGGSFNSANKHNDNTGNIVAKCTRCGKFQQRKKMHISGQEMFCETCNNATEKFHGATLDTPMGHPYADAYNDWGYYAG